MSSRWHSVVVALGLIGTCAYRLAGQAAATGTVRGMIRGEDGRVVQGAEVTVRSNTATRSARSGDDGRFSIITEAGKNDIAIRMLGRQPIDTTLQIPAGETIEITEMLVRVSSLDTVVTRAQPVECRDPTTIDGFNCRRLNAHGLFLDQGDIERRKPYFLGDLFFAMPGMEVIATKTGRSFRSKDRCMVTLVDGRPIVGRPPEPRDLLGVEVYQKYQDIPAQYRTFSWMPPGAKRPPPFTCAIVNLWTRNADRRR